MGREANRTAAVSRPAQERETPPSPPQDQNTTARETKHNTIKTQNSKKQHKPKPINRPINHGGQARKTESEFFSKNTTQVGQPAKEPSGAHRFNRRRAIASQQISQSQLHLSTTQQASCVNQTTQEPAYVAAPIQPISHFVFYAGCTDAPLPAAPAAPPPPSSGATCGGLAASACLRLCTAIAAATRMSAATSPADKAATST